MLYGANMVLLANYLLRTQGIIFRSDYIPKTKNIYRQNSKSLARPFILNVELNRLVHNTQYT